MSDDARLQKILERVKALHRLAKSTHSQGEAEAANFAAQQLITRYRLEQKLRETTECDDDYAEIIIFAKHKARILWKEQVIYNVCHTNGCEVLIFGVENPREKGISYKVYGKKENLKICQILVDLIIDQIDYLAKAEDTIKGKDGKDAFKTGCAQRVSERLTEGFQSELEQYINSNSLSSAQQNALVLLNESELGKSRKFMEQKISGPVRTIFTREKLLKEGAFEAGKRAGDKVELSARKKLPK